MASPASLRLKAFGGVVVLAIVVLALAVHVNQFMGYFYVADRFPLIMASLTLPLVIIAVVNEFVHSGDVRTAAPIFELSWIGALLITWTGANAFSTSRWSNITMDSCKAIVVEQDPEFFGPAKTWCYEIQALRAFVWIEWALLLVVFVSLVVFCVGQARRGSSHVWTTPIQRFDPLASRSGPANTSYGTEKQTDYSREVKPAYIFDMRQEEGGVESPIQPPRTTASPGPNDLSNRMDPFAMPRPTYDRDAQEYSNEAPPTWQQFPQYSEYSNQYTNQYSNQYSNQSSNQYSNQYRA